MSFEDAARQFSECPSRAETPAGSLGSFAPGKMVAEFDAYIFNPTCAVPAPVPASPASTRPSLGRSKVGEIAVVDTTFGTHLVKILERSDKFDPKKTKTDGGWSF